MNNVLFFLFFFFNPLFSNNPTDLFHSVLIRELENPQDGIQLIGHFSWDPIFEVKETRLYLKSESEQLDLPAFLLPGGHCLMVLKPDQLLAFLKKEGSIEVQVENFSGTLLKQDKPIENRFLKYFKNTIVYDL